jgi:hypothetical protein
MVKRLDFAILKILLIVKDVFVRKHVVICAGEAGASHARCLFHFGCVKNAAIVDLRIDTRS